MLHSNLVFSPPSGDRSLSTDTDYAWNSLRPLSKPPTRPRNLPSPLTNHIAPSSKPRPSNNIATNRNHSVFYSRGTEYTRKTSDGKYMPVFNYKSKMDAGASQANPEGDGGKKYDHGVTVWTSLSSYFYTISRRLSNMFSGSESSYYYWGGNNLDGSG